MTPTPQTNEEIIAEIKRQLDNPLSGLKHSSNTNKIRYGILGDVTDALAAKDSECQKKIEEAKMEQKKEDAEIAKGSTGCRPREIADKILNQ